MSSNRGKRSKKQTRLNFTPVPSSSPQRSEAHVRLNDASSPLKKRRINGPPESISGHRELSPDIAETVALSKHDSLRILLSSPHRIANQLPTPEPSSQIEPAGDEGTRRRRPGGVNTAKPTQSAATRSSPSTHQEQKSVESEETRPRRSSQRIRQSVTKLDSSSSDESDPITPVTKRTRKLKKAAAVSSPSECSDEEIKVRQKSSRTPTARSFLAGGSSGNAPVRRGPKHVRKFSLPKKGLVSLVGSASGEEETASTRANILKTDAGCETRRTPQIKATDNREEEEEEEEEDDDDDDSDAILVSPSRRRASQMRSAKWSEEDEDSMLEELGDAEDEEELQTRRTRSGQGNTARNKRLEGLEKLRERRAGVAEVSEPEDEYTEEGQDEDDSEEIHDSHSMGDERPGENLDEYESDFVEDDGEIGVDLMKHGVPLKFTGHANKKPFDYFKDEVEWMIHNKLDPAFERNDEIYEMAHQKLNDEVMALAGSEFRSSVWMENFTKALQSRPELYTTAVGLDSMEVKCQACNRSKHPPKWMITFSGPTYDRNSLEKVSPKDDVVDGSHSSSSEDESDEVEENEERWHVGSVCCGNAEIAHTLYHWRYQLNATILQWLTLNDHTTPTKIIERENWSRKKKEKFANKIVDGMLESGEMRSLYQQFKQNLDAARAAKMEKVERW